MPTVDDTAHTSPFGEALWGLTHGLEQLRTLAANLADQYEHAAAPPRFGGAREKSTSSSGPRSPPKGTSGHAVVNAKQSVNGFSEVGHRDDAVTLGVFRRPVPQQLKKPCLGEEQSELRIKPKWMVKKALQLPGPPVSEPLPNSTESRLREKARILKSGSCDEAKALCTEFKKLGASDRYTEFKKQGSADAGCERAFSKSSLHTSSSGYLRHLECTSHASDGSSHVVDSKLIQASQATDATGISRVHFGADPLDELCRSDSQAFYTAASTQALDERVWQSQKSVLLREVWKHYAGHMNLPKLAGVFQLTIKSTTDYKLVRSVAPGRNRSVNLEHSLHIFSAASEGFKTLAKLKRNATGDRSTNSTCILHPMGATRLVWCLFTILMIMWDMIFIPMEAFPMPKLKLFNYVEWAITIFWTLDIFVTFRTGFIAGARIEMRPTRIAAQYIKTWFMVDMFIVGMEWAGRFLTAFISGGSLLRATRVVRAVRSVRLLRLAKLQVLIAMIEDQVNSAAVQLLFVLAKMTTALVVVIHFLACLWFAVGDSTPDGWVGYANIPPCGPRPQSGGRDPMPDDESKALQEMMEWYAYSTRWVLAQANGRIDQDARRNMAEMAFTCIAAVLGPMLCMAVFVSSITATMMELNQMAHARRVNRMRLNQYLTGHSVSATLVARMKAYLRNHRDPDKEQESETFVLTIMPKQLQKDLMYEIRSPILVVHKFFDAINTHFPQAIKHVTMEALQPFPVHQDETVFETGDACTRMLFAYRGLFHYAKSKIEDAYVTPTKDMQKVLRDPSDVISTVSNRSREGHQEVGKGVWLSEAAVWLEWQNQGRLTALNDGCFFSLESQSFTQVVKSYGDVLCLTVAYAIEFESTLRKHASLSDIVDVEVCFTPKNQQSNRESTATHCPQREPSRLSRAVASIFRGSQHPTPFTRRGKRSQESSVDENDEG